MASDLSVHIEKLSKDNYDTWKIHMEAILVKNDLSGYVNGSKLRPTLASQSTPGVVATTEDIALWDKHDRKARADIVLAVS